MSCIGWNDECQADRIDRKRHEVTEKKNRNKEKEKIEIEMGWTEADMGGGGVEFESTRVELTQKICKYVGELVPFARCAEYLCKVKQKREELEKTYT